MLGLCICFFSACFHGVRKNSESDPSEAKRARLVAKRNDICGNINLRLV